MLARRAFLGVVVGCLAVPPIAARPLPAPPPTVAVVDFRNVTGAPEALRGIMPAVATELERRGFDVVRNGPIDRFLRERRIRSRDALALEHLQALADVVGARYVLVGAVDTWADNGGPEIGLTARLLDAADGRVRWAGEACLHALDAPGLLAMGRPGTLDAAAGPAARRLFDSLELRESAGVLEPGMPRRRPTRRLLAPLPITYRSPDFDPQRPLRVAVLPFDNRSSTPEAPLVIGDRLLIRLLALPTVDVVDPGELLRTLIDHDIQPLYGVSPAQMLQLNALLGVDALLDGSVLRYENGSGSIPHVDLSIRLRDAATGRVLWSATTSRGGERTRTVFDLGRIRGVDRLAESALNELLSTWGR